MDLKVQMKQAGKKATSIETSILHIDNKPSTVEELLILTVKSTLKGRKNIDQKTAINTCLEAFEDGLIALFIDDNRYENLKDKIELTGNEVLTFIKLTMLAGRMW